MNKKLSLVIPFYNEESNVEAVVKEASGVLKDMASDYEILAVNDGSIDETRYLLDGLAKKIRQVKVLHHKINRGYGAALMTGIEAATGDYVLLSDGDGQFYLKELKEIVQNLKDYDVVLGYRINRQDPWYRKLNSFIYNYCARVLVGVKIRDINCALKGFRFSALKGVKGRTAGRIINSDILSQVFSKDVKIKEVGVNHKPRLSGVQTGAKLSVILRAARDFIIIFLAEFPKRKREMFFGVRILLGFLFAFYLFVEAEPSRSARFFVGMLLAFAGVFFRNWASGYIKKSKVLSVSGPYSIVRHPLYFGSLLAGMGAVISIWNKQNYLDGILFIALFLWLFIFVYIPKIESEEKNLSRWFQDEFEQYKKKTGALFPRISGLSFVPGKFKWSLWKKNKEYNSVVGFIIFYLIMFMKR